MSPWPAPKPITCDMCRGSGEVPDPIPGDRRNTKTCPNCGGRGEL